MEENRIEEVLRRLDAIETRLSRLEAHEVTPPPVVPFQAVTPSTQIPPPFLPPILPTLPRLGGARTDDEAEYFIGAKVLPRVGAAVLVMMLAYLASIAYNQGLIGPETIFGGVVALCSVLIGIGQWKRNEREEFGQILTGIGSCGLFLDFAAGHVFQKLYPGETLVALFVVLSLVNVAYSLWRSSRAFLAIGMIGGLAAAMMPLERHQAYLAFDLYLLILIPAAIVAAYRRWSDAALVVWIAGALATIPIGLTHGVPWSLGVLALEATGVLGLATYAWTTRGGEGKVPALAAAATTFLTGLGAFGFRWGMDGAAHVSLFVAASAVVALLAKGSVRSTLQAGAAFTFLTIVPFGFERLLILFVLLLFAAGCTAASFAFPKRTLLALAAVEVVLAFIQYTVLVENNAISLASEWLTLGVIAAIGMVAGRRIREESEEAEMPFLLFVVGAAGRGGYVASLQAGWLEPAYAVTAACLIASIAALVLGFWRRQSSLRILSFIGFGLTTAKALLYDLATAAPFARVGLLFALGTALLVGGYWYIRRNPLTPGPLSDKPLK